MSRLRETIQQMAGKQLPQQKGASKPLSKKGKSRKSNSKKRSY